MKVYIVVDHDIESDTILGVYATKDAAERDQDARGHFEHLPVGNERWAAVAWHHAFIQEWDVRP